MFQGIDWCFIFRTGETSVPSSSGDDVIKLLSFASTGSYGGGGGGGGGGGYRNGGGYGGK